YSSQLKPWASVAASLNCLKDPSERWVKTLEMLTQRSNIRFLTMHVWADVVSMNGTIRLERAWCPCCYAEWRENGLDLYEPLLWAFNVITICPLHNQQLQIKCHGCHKTQKRFTAKTETGFCLLCSQWLGTLSKKEMADSKKISND